MSNYYDIETLLERYGVFEDCRLEEISHINIEGSARIKSNNIIKKIKAFRLYTIHKPSKSKLLIMLCNEKAGIHVTLKEGCRFERKRKEMPERKIEYFPALKKKEFSCTATQVENEKVSFETQTNTISYCDQSTQCCPDEIEAAFAQKPEKKKRKKTKRIKTELRPKIEEKRIDPGDTIRKKNSLTPVTDTSTKVFYDKPIKPDPIIEFKPKPIRRGRQTCQEILEQSKEYSVLVRRRAMDLEDDGSALQEMAAALAAEW